MIAFTEEHLRDRIYACWIGKSIGGTLGTPYEGKRQLMDIQGFASKAGEPLPNDDLDLQLVWLRAVDELGPQNINSKTLGEYWTTWITPHWNEYGVCKANMREGILPPMSGEINNEEWRNSNGAWIRTEIWACLYPCRVENAIRMAFEDASVDHGYAEGTYAAIFVAAMESAAFAISNARSLLEIGLSKIPEDCRVARSVRLAMDAYDHGTPWRDARELLVADSADLGWFQAPCNVAFVVLGLLYGQGDFKRSLILAVNCGDDTDCTGATLGALMGIMGGMAAIPEDWRKYVGDAIKSICLTNGHGPFPSTCTQLTDCVMNLLPVTLRTDNRRLMGGETGRAIAGKNDFTEATVENFSGRAFVNGIAGRKRYSFVIESVCADALIEFDDKPVIAPMGALSGTVTLIPHTMPEQKHYCLRFLPPEGWTVESVKNLFTPALRSQRREYASARFVIRAGERVEAVNRVVLEIVSAGRPTPILAPIQILG